MFFCSLLQFNQFMNVLLFTPSVQPVHEMFCSLLQFNQFMKCSVFTPPVQPVHEMFSCSLLQFNQFMKCSPFTPPVQPVHEMFSCSLLQFNQLMLVFKDMLQRVCHHHKVEIIVSPAVYSTWQGGIRAKELLARWPGGCLVARWLLGGQVVARLPGGC